MSETTLERPPGMRVDELRTKRAVARTFSTQGSPRVITTVVVVTAAVRFGVWPTTWGWADLLVLALTVAAVGVVEWAVHLFLLHAPPDAWTSRRLGTGAGHRRHHLDPPALEWLLLRGVDAAVFAPIIAVLTVVWSVPAVAAFGWSVGGQALAAPVVTALLAAFLALWHYEWTHLLIHTGYRPRTRYYKRLARNHRRHHYRNERFWLGITSSSGDRLLGTYPTDSAAVPPSDTARTLG